MDKKRQKGRKPATRKNGKGKSKSHEHEVLLLDPDETALKELADVLAPSGYRVRPHLELEDLLKTGKPKTPSCLVVCNQPNGGMDGLQVIDELKKHNWDLPVVVLAVHWTIEIVVHSMRAGADGFLAKPFEPEKLLDAVNHALESSRKCYRNGISAAEARNRVASLNPRELEIVRLVVNGFLNKEISDRIGLALVTVKVYRSRVMEKLGAGNAAELVNIATLGGLEFASGHIRRRRG